MENMRIVRGILSIPQNIVMNLNNVMIIEKRKKKLITETNILFGIVSSLLMLSLF